METGMPARRTRRRDADRPESRPIGAADPCELAADEEPVSGERQRAYPGFPVEAVSVVLQLGIPAEDAPGGSVHGDEIVPRPPRGRLEDAAGVNGSASRNEGADEGGWLALLRAVRGFDAEQPGRQCEPPQRSSRLVQVEGLQPRTTAALR